MQPNFRDKIDSFRNRTLESMDNRNLSKKEREALEATKKAIRDKRIQKKDKNAVKEVDDLDDEDELGLTPKEHKILR